MCHDHLITRLQGQVCSERQGLASGSGIHPGSLPLPGSAMPSLACRGPHVLLVHLKSHPFSVLPSRVPLKHHSQCSSFILFSHFPFPFLSPFLEKAWWGITTLSKNVQE